MNTLFLDNRVLSISTRKYSTLDKKQLRIRRLLSCFAGLLIGAINGLFGAGGGMLAVPVLTYLLDLDEKSAHATAIAIILPLCAISSIVYGVSIDYDLLVIIPTVIGVMIGSFIGAKLLKKLSDNVLAFLFYGLMLFAGFKMIFE